MKLFQNLYVGIIFYNTCRQVDISVFVLTPKSITQKKIFLLFQLDIEIENYKPFF